MAEEFTRPPKVFISYAWEDDVLPWVKKLAKRLRDNGVETVLDQWETDYGDQLPEFMEKAVRESDFVILICTPKYKKKSNDREGGVGYEGHIITAEIFEKNNQRKFIPVLRKGGWSFAAPSWAVGKLYIDLSGNPYKEENYRKLLRTLLGKKPSPPPVGIPPEFPDDDDDTEQPALFSRFFVVLKEGLSKSFASLKTALPNAFPFLRIVGFTGIGIALLWGGSLAIPQFIELIPTAKASVVAPSTNTKVVATKTLVPLTKTLIPSASPTKVQTATPIVLPTEITDAKGVLMVLVPAGEFIMGGYAKDALEECKKNYGSNCYASGFEDSEPPHKVYLDKFYMDKYEVTNALYESCVIAGVCVSPQRIVSDTRSSYYGDPLFGDYPVMHVNWHQANLYCEWRNASLPTEAQWEKAARGTDGRTYPWGEGNNCNNTNLPCVKDTTKVGSYEKGKSTYGIYDLIGNVWEWTADWYLEDYYSISVYSNPLGPETGDQRVVRGNPSSTAYSRGNLGPTNYWNIGFRCAKDAP